MTYMETKTGRTIFIGDVHGCPDELQKLYLKLKPRAGIDRFVFCGDIVDKGPDTLTALRLVKEILLAHPGSVCVSGNHEEKAFRFYDHDRVSQFVNGNKGRAWAYDATEADWSFIRSMPLTWFDKDLDIRVVHAGIPPSILVKHPDIFQRIEERGAKWRKGGGKSMNRARRMLRVRFVDKDGDMLTYGENKHGDPFWAHVYDRSQGMVVFGHCPALDGKVKRYGSTFQRTAIGIDTGCVFGAKLTAYVVQPGEADQYVQVDAAKQYAPIMREED